MDSDIILLDEPTNHLSPDLVEQLEDALRDYTGAVVTVTHDRRWLNNAARVTPDRLLRYATATPTTTGGVLDTPSRLNSLS